MADDSSAEKSSIRLYKWWIVGLGVIGAALAAAFKDEIKTQVEAGWHKLLPEQSAVGPAVQVTASSGSVAVGGNVSAPITINPSTAAVGVNFGAWQSYSGVGGRGTPFCSILSTVTNKDIGQNVIIKGFKGADSLVVDLYKDTWNRPSGSYVTVMFDFVDNQPLSLPAYADAHILDIEIPTRDVGIFLTQVAKSPALQVIFPETNESWAVGGGGSQDAVRELVSCIKKLKQEPKK